MNDKEAVMKYKEDFIKHNDTLNGTGYLDELNTYEEWLKDTYGSMDKATVKDEWVCSIQYLAYNKKKQLVGMAQLRLDLNDFLKEYGGHIGLSVAREFRNQKYAKSILKDMIYMAKQSGINPIMISCDTNNVYSKKLILSCNAQFIETRYCSQFDINVDVFNIYY
ncbi:MAG: GNAT family N-acetyltransferase [Bacilli bacterium]|nr:GNAT family N-acetyltransferase [Bacilli bacterium]